MMQPDLPPSSIDVSWLDQYNLLTIILAAFGFIAIVPLTCRVIAHLQRRSFDDVGKSESPKIGVGVR
jgi:hypothetical protein